MLWIACMHYWPWATGAVLVGMLISALHKIYTVKPHGKTLYIRRLKEEGAGDPEYKVDLSKGRPKDANVFYIEFSTFFNIALDHFDYAAMKAIGDDVPLLVEQEHQHAKLHIQLQKTLKEKKETWTRWTWLEVMFEKLLLRCGLSLGTALVGSFEAVGHSVLPESVLALGPDNMMLFHMMEEVEHGPITVEQLTQKLPFWYRAVLYPLYAGAFFLVLFAPIPVYFIGYPMAILRPRTYIDLIDYLIVFIPAYIGCLFEVVYYWIFAAPVDLRRAYSLFYSWEKELKSRGVSWDILKEETYILYPREEHKSAHEAPVIPKDHPRVTAKALEIANADTVKADTAKAA